MDILAPIPAPEPMGDPFTPAGHRAARQLAGRYGDAVASVLPARTRLAEARSPARARWRWLGRLSR